MSDQRIRSSTASGRKISVERPQRDRRAWSMYDEDSGLGQVTKSFHTWQIDKINSPYSE